MSDTVKSVDNALVHGMVVLNPDGTKVGGTVTVDPTGLATDTNQTNGSQKTQIVDAGGEAVTVTGGKLDVNASVDTTGLALDATLTGGTQKSQIVDAGGEGVTVTGGKLDVNASIDTTGLATTTTDTNTGTIAGDTTSIDAKIPALGQALAAASVPVVLPVAQITTLTPPAAITGFATSAKQDTIIGHIDGVEALLGTIDTDTGNIATEVAGLLTDTELRATPVPVSGSLTVDLGANNDVTVTSGAITETNSGAIKTSVELIDDAIYTDGAGTPSKAIAVAGTDGTNPQIIKTDANGELQVDVLSMPSTTITATDLDIRNLVNTDVVTAELSATDNAVLDTIAAKDFATQTTLAAINAKLVTGTDIGDVTINNSTGAAAVNIQDGGNTITVDGTVAVTNADLTTLAGAVSATHMQVDIVGALPAGTAAIGKLAANSGVDIGDVTLTASTNNIGDVDVLTLPALPAGTNAIGKLAANSGVDIGDVDVTSISAGTNLIGDIGIQPRTTNGLDTFMASGSDGSTILVATAQAVKASAGKVYGYYLYNPEAAVTFVHFYNTASASVTVGTTNPLFTLAIPAGSAANLMNDIGITFGTAISMAATTTAGGNTAPATGVSAIVWFK